MTQVILVVPKHWLTGLASHQADLIIDESGEVLKDRSGSIKSVDVDKCTVRNLFERHR